MLNICLLQAVDERAHTDDLESFPKSRDIHTSMVEARFVFRLFRYTLLRAVKGGIGAQPCDRFVP